MKKFIVCIIMVSGSFLNVYGQSLDDYFKLAAENNLGLRAKYKSFEASLERIVQVSNLPDPNLSFGYFISPIETRVGPQRARFSLSQMFPWFGTLKAKEDVATLLAEAKYQEFLDARNKLYYQVSAAYYSLFELYALIEIEKENQRILTSYKTIATVQFQNNKSDMVDVLRVDIMLKDANANLSILEQKKRPLESQFNSLLSRSSTEPVFVSDSLVQVKVPEGYRKDSLLSSNPLLDELDLKLKASNAKEEVALKQGLPSLGVGLDYVLVSERTDINMPENGKNALMPMVSVSLPIFRAKYKAAVNEAQYMQDYYALKKEDISNNLVSTYDIVWFKLQKQTELIKLYDEQIKTSTHSLNLLFSAYGNSGKDFEEVLLMQQQILKYQKMKATALSEYHIALAELDYITAKSK
ncbi:MAG: TolC family protein [Bacteroidia bacterium]